MWGGGSWQAGSATVVPNTLVLQRGSKMTGWTPDLSPGFIGNCRPIKERCNNTPALGTWKPGCWGRADSMGSCDSRKALLH